MINNDNEYNNYINLKKNIKIKMNELLFLEKQINKYSEHFSLIDELMEIPEIKKNKKDKIKQIKQNEIDKIKQFKKIFEINNNSNNILKNNQLKEIIIKYKIKITLLELKKYLKLQGAIDYRNSAGRGLRYISLLT